MTTKKPKKKTGTGIDGAVELIESLREQPTDEAFDEIARFMRDLDFPIVWRDPLAGLMFSDAACRSPLPPPAFAKCDPRLGRMAFQGDDFVRVLERVKNHVHLTRDRQQFLGDLVGYLRDLGRYYDRTPFVDIPR